ncbi:MAG: lipopolysaccharide kinase InaA family protein [Phycisphaerae bacterium]|nr:lipopolysaccharide kinase InaA family protein [Phycisphaerae bacterium]
MEIHNTNFEAFKRDEWKITALKASSRQQISNLLAATDRNSKTEIAAVSSSDYTDVFAANIGGFKKKLYFKKYLYRSKVDFVKHIFRSGRAKRSLAASIILRQKGFNTPQIIALLEKIIGPFTIQSFLITEEAENSGSVVQYWQTPIVSGGDLFRKRQFIESFGTTIGKLHSAGIFHGDLRLNNVLVQDHETNWKFYFIDNERTKKFGAIPKRLRLKNLVQLYMFGYSLPKTDQMRFFRAYCDAAKIGKKEAKHIAQVVAANTLRRIKRRAADRTGIPDVALQTQWAFQRACLDNRYGIFQMEFCKGCDAADFLRQIDHLVEIGTVLKDDKATRVVRCTYNNRDIVVKRYNYQGLWHSVRHTIKGSRAMKCWRFGIQLIGYGISCAESLAMVEQRRFGIIVQSYIVNAFVEGPLLYDVMNRAGYSDDERKAVLEKAQNLLKQLGFKQLTHSDMKPANVIICNGEPVLIDLDSMQQHRWQFYFRYRYRKMIDYFHCRMHGKK